MGRVSVVHEVVDDTDWITVSIGGVAVLAYALIIYEGGRESDWWIVGSGIVGVIFTFRMLKGVSFKRKIVVHKIKGDDD